MAPPSNNLGHNPNRKNLKQNDVVVKASAFDALKSMGDSDDSEDSAGVAIEIASTVTPSQSCAELSLVDSDDSGAEWAAVPRRRKPQAPKAPVVPQQPDGTAAATPKQACDTLGSDADGEWLAIKGQRHAHTKSQKQEWNYKSKKRTAYAQQKRSDQRSSAVPLGGFAEDDEF